MWLSWVWKNKRCRTSHKSHVKTSANNQDMQVTIKLQVNKSLCKLLHSNKCNTAVIMDSIDFNNKLQDLITIDIHFLPKDPTKTIEDRLLKTNSDEVLANVKIILTPYNSKPPHTCMCAQ